MKAKSHIEWWSMIILHLFAVLIVTGAVAKSLPVRFSVAGIVMAVGMYFDVLSTVLLLAIPPKSGILGIPLLIYFSSVFVLRNSLDRWQIILLVICAVAFHSLCQIFIPRLVISIRSVRTEQGECSIEGVGPRSAEEQTHQEG